MENMKKLEQIVAEQMDAVAPRIRHIKVAGKRLRPVKPIAMHTLVKKMAQGELKL